MMLKSSRNDDDPESRRSRSSKLGLYLAAALFVAAAIGAGIYALEQNGVDVQTKLNDARIESEDAATTAAVKTALALSSKVSAFAVDVSTSKGVVQLDGTVPSQTVRDLAGAIARDTTGVDDVENRLVVVPDTRPSPEMDRLKSRIADLEIRAELHARLTQEQDIDADAITVSVDDRTVKLGGEVEDISHKTAAEQIAWETPNVVQVVNEIRVKTPESTRLDGRTESRSLHENVRFELYASGAFNLDLMDVRARDGSVTLSGSVRSQAERLLAERIVSDVRGVRDVVNELDVIALSPRATLVPDATKRAIVRLAAQSGALW